MDNKKIASILTFIGLAAASGEALAMPFIAFDPRSFAMGGTGVASGTSANASFYNPALLAAAHHHDDFSLELPIVAASVADPDNLVKAANDFNNNKYMSNFSNAVTAFNTDPTNSANRNALLTSAQNLETGLQSLSNKTLQGQLDAGMVVGIPSRSLGVALYVNGWMVGGGEAKLSQSDISTIDTIINDIKSGSTGSITDPTAAGSSNSFTSSLEARFALLAETGVSLAREFTIGADKISLGVTPKFVQVRTYDYAFSGKSLDNAKVSLNDGETTSSNFNLDVGAVKKFGGNLQTGLSIKNLIPETYTTALGNTIKVDPQARVGVAMQNSWNTLAADLDLTENQPVGFDTKTRYLGLGGELNALSWAQVRIGYRYNIADAKTSVATAGIGLSPFGVHMDLAVEGGAHELGASFQTGFRF
jgi:hypothetical protein